MFSLISIFTSDVRFIPILWDESNKNESSTEWMMGETNQQNVMLVDR